MTGDPSTTIHDAIVIGAGPAGLTAAVYLARFRRRCLVLEDGHSRAQWIPTSHNIPGFTAGIGGTHFLGSLRAQALRYGAQIRRAHVSSLTVEDGLFVVRSDTDTLRARHVLLATGVRDRLPAIAGATDAVLRSVLRICPICDAFEAIDKRIAVIGDGALGVREADFLRTYSDRVSLLDIGLTPSEQSDGAGGIERMAIRLSDIRIREDRITWMGPNGERTFDVAYVALGCRTQRDLALSLNAECDEQGFLRVNAHQETSVPRLYAAGDVVRGINQVVVAAEESAIAATDIHNQLRRAGFHLATALSA